MLVSLANGLAEYDELASPQPITPEQQAASNAADEEARLACEEGQRQADEDVCRAYYEDQRQADAMELQAEEADREKAEVKRLQQFFAIPPDIGWGAERTQSGANWWVKNCAFPYPVTNLSAIASPPVIFEGIAVDGESLVGGGPPKSLKTSIFVDFAVSAATATPFLNHFRCVDQKKRNVIYYSGESGNIIFGELFRRVCESKQLEVSGFKNGKYGNFQFLDRVPPIDDEYAGEGIKKLIKALEAHIICIDPAYLALRRVNMNNVFKVGQALKSFADACLEQGALPILVHHATKDIRPGKPLELHQLAFAGIAEFARGWILLNPRRRYAPSAIHALTMSVGGSNWSGSVWSVDIDESLQNGRRLWKPTVTDITGGHQRDANAQAGDNFERERVKRDTYESRLKQALKATAIGEVVGFTALRDAARMNNDNMGTALLALVEDGSIAVLPGRPRQLRRLR